MTLCFKNIFKNLKKFFWTFLRKTRWQPPKWYSCFWIKICVPVTLRRNHNRKQFIFKQKIWINLAASLIRKSQRGYMCIVWWSFTNCTGHVLHFHRSISILKYSGGIFENIYFHLSRKKFSIKKLWATWLLVIYVTKN